MTLKELIKLVEELDIIEVAQTCLGLTFVRQGVRYECLCPNPYHHDKHIGNFSIRRDTKMWGCFACDLGQHRGNISLVASVTGRSFSEAAVEIGEAFGLISSADGSALLSGANIKKVGYVPKPQGEQPSYITNKKSVQELDKVYRSFVQACPPMTQTQKERLMKERFLSESDLRDFFLIPAKTPEFWASFKKALAANGLSGSLSEILTGVPGFFCYKSNRRWSFQGTEGELGLISRNANDLICGFQIRRNNVSRGPKYVCFSSGSLDFERYENICSSGILVGVEKPRGPVKHNIIAITEGKFKAIALSKMGYWAVAVSGVGSWKRVIPVVAGIIKRHVPNPTFVIAFDMDMKVNPAVSKHAKALSHCLSDTFHCKVMFADWDLALGKGIDDMVNNGHKDCLKFFPAKDYLENTFFNEVA